jgi:hypothetical protein
MAMSHSRCIPPHERIDQVMNEVNNIVITGATYTAGDGIDAAQLALNIIQTSIDGVSIIFDAGVMKAVAASDLVAGCGITIAAGEVSAATDGTTIDCIGGNLSVIAYAFGKIVVATQTDVDADQVVDTLTLVAGANMAITTSGGTITFVSTDTNWLIRRRVTTHPRTMRRLAFSGTPSKDSTTAAINSMGMSRTMARSRK